ncbi:MAG: M81 family metallopeptidase [Planctomycetota bacterium]|nr:M81 family metallopeptidase [Planctomycetota bacterium]
MRIVSGGVQHETNTFSKIPTTLADFVRDSNCGETLAGGETIFERFRGTGSIHGGYISGAEAAGFELVPLLCAKAQPSGLVEKTAFDTMLGWFVERLKEEQPFDGVLLDLHGAMVAEHHEDAEAAFVAAVRDVVGAKMPIVVTLDLHANISARLAELADVIIGFDTYPHVDMQDRGHEAAELIARIVKGEITPVQEFRQLPLITLPPRQCTLRDPMQTLMARVHQMEQEAGVLTATVAMGFPFADIPDTGASIMVTTDGDAELARAKADELAGWLWDLRDELQPELTTIEDAMTYANDHPDDGLVIFADGSDNPGGGAPCDGTIALHALIDAGFKGGVVGVIYDPETAAQAHRAGVGATIPVRLGGKTDNLHGAPVERDAYVRALCDGKYIYRGPMMHGVQDNLGPTATLIVGGVEVVVSSQRRQCFDAEMLRIAGVDPVARRLLVLKSAVHFRADFGPLAGRIFDADTPGIHRPDLAAFDFQRLRRPIYPLDDLAQWMG